MTQSNNQNFIAYIALGDSSVIDRYPDTHAAQLGGAPEVERTALGAASLLFQNADVRYPEFRGRDLASLGVRSFLPLAEDGATTRSVLEVQIPRVARSEEPTLVTLAVGGNDFLGLLGVMERGLTRQALEGVSAIPQNVGRILQAIKARRPNATIAVTTIYDPTDATWVFPEWGIYEPQPALGAAFEAVNDAIRRVTAAEGAILVDVHRHFQGHGVESEDCWYWEPQPIEPSVTGAHEIRRLFVEAVALDAIGDRSGSAAVTQERRSA